MKKNRYVARLGLSTAIPALILGEMGFDIDTKTFRVGDDSSTPTKIPTTGSRGQFEFPLVDLVKYKNIDVYEGGKVAGLPLPQIKNNAGFVVYNKTTNTFVHRKLDHDDYISITYPNGVEGDPKIGVSDALLDGISRLGNLGGFSYGPRPPATLQPSAPGGFVVTINPGHMWWSTVDELLYVLVADSPTTSWWVDIGGAGGGGGGNQTYVGPELPDSPRIGDYYIDTTDGFRCYWYTRDEASIYWREITH